MEHTQKIRQISSVHTLRSNVKQYMKGILFTLLLASPLATQAQDVQVKVNPSPMIGMNMETKKMMAGANIELISVGNDKRRVGGGITPVVYFEENMPGKLGPSVQVTRKFDQGELRAILGAHGGQTFIGIGGKATFGGRKKG